MAIASVRIRQLLRRLRTVRRQPTVRRLRSLSRDADDLAAQLEAIADRDLPVDRRAQAAKLVRRIAQWAREAVAILQLGGSATPPSGLLEDAERALIALLPTRDQTTG